MTIMDHMVTYLPETDRAKRDYNYHKEQNLEIDTREFGNHILSSFPFPIGKEFMRFFSADCMQYDETRFKQMLLVFERLVQFNAYTIMAQIWELKRSQNFKLTEIFQKKIAQWFEKPASIGTLWSLIHSGAKNMADENIQFLNQFDPKLFHGKALNKKVNELIEIRNAWAHGGLQLNHAYVEKLFTEIVCEFTFVIKIKLIAIRDISVQKKRFKEPNYYHRIVELHNSSANDSIFEDYYENNTVVLLDNIKKPSFYLNLSPLIIDVDIDLSANSYQSERVKGICVFNKGNQNKLVYSLTDSKREITIDDEEYKHLFNTMKADFSS